MSARRRLRSLPVALVLLVGITVGLESSVSAGGSRPAAPVGLEATAFATAVHLTWQPGSDEPGVTYTFEVTAIDADGDESEPSNRVSVTIPWLGPPRSSSSPAGSRSTRFA